MNKVALVTGASSGIGRELARIFIEKQYHVVLVARNEQKLNEIKQEYPGAAVTIIAKDLQQPNAARALYYDVKGKGLHVHTLVNNAGFGDYGYFHSSNWQKQQDMIQLNISVLTELCYLFGNDMLKAGSGRVMNLASVAAFFPGPLMSVYYATKHYVLAFSEAVANEWRDKGVTVTALCPGPTESNFVAAANAGGSRLFSKKLPTSREVAIFGYNAMVKGRTVAVHGISNKLLILSGRFAPRNIIATIVRRMSDPK